MALADQRYQAVHAHPSSPLPPARSAHNGAIGESVCDGGGLTAGGRQALRALEISTAACDDLLAQRRSVQPLEPLPPPSPACRSHRCTEGDVCPPRSAERTDGWLRTMMKSAPCCSPRRVASTSLRPRRRAALLTADAARQMAAHITTQRQQPGEAEGAGAEKVAELQAKARPPPY